MNVKFMKTMGLIILLLTPLIMNASSETTGFTADMIQKKGDETIEGRIFVSGDMYRMDMTEGGEDISIIVNCETEKTKIIIHSQKKYQEIENRDFKSLSNDPFEYYKFAVEKYEPRKSGTETLNGHECQKKEIYAGSEGEVEKITTAWISDKLDWPIKIILNIEPSMEMELKSIEEKSIEESLFELPEDYEVLSPPEVKKSEETSQPEKQETKTPTREAGSAEEAIFNKLEEKGVKKVNEDGTVKLHQINVKVLVDYFPDWIFFHITREKKIQGGTSFSYMQYDKAAATEDGKKVITLSSPATDMPLNGGLEIAQGANVQLKNKEDVEKFAEALDAMYFKSSKVENVESLGENKWAVYTGTFMNHIKGFIIKTGDDGKIKELNYKLKIKEK